MIADTAWMSEVTSRAGVGLMVVVLAGACTAEDHGAAHVARQHTSAPSLVTPVGSPAHEQCIHGYPSVRAWQSSTAGAVRFLGPRPVAAPGNFTGLADTAAITLCLVPDHDGLFAVYGVPVTAAPAKLLWMQNVDSTFTWPT